MTDTIKQIVLVLVNAAFAVVLVLAGVNGWNVELVWAFAGVVVIVLDVWAGITWEPPKRD